MSVPERGVVYKASAKAYLGNYIIGAFVVVLAFLVVTRFGIGFGFSDAGEAMGSLVYVAFGAAAGWMFGEPVFETVVRKYVISNHGIVKVEGILWKRRHSIPYQSVSESRVTKGVFGRIFNYGTIEISSMNEGGISMRHVSDPDEIHRIVQHRVGSMRSALSSRKGRPRAEKQDKDEDSLE